MPHQLSHLVAMPLLLSYLDLAACAWLLCGFYAYSRSFHLAQSPRKELEDCLLFTCLGLISMWLLPRYEREMSPQDRAAMEEGEPKW